VKEYDIPVDLRSYSPAELHRAANALTMESGKQPQMTLETMLQKLNRHDLSLIVVDEAMFTLVENGGDGLRECVSVVELSTALRLSPVFLNKPLYFRGQPCEITETVSNGFTIKVDEREHFVWRSGAEKVLTNSQD
jgi:hypothetical protein